MPNKQRNNSYLSNELGRLLDNNPNIPVTLLEDGHGIDVDGE